MKNFKVFSTCYAQDGKKDVLLHWVFFSQDDFRDEFIIEKSRDNQHFEIIGKEAKITHSQKLFRYLFVDENIESGTNYYRVFLKKRKPSKKIISTSKIITITDDKYIRNNEITRMELETADFISK